MDPINFLVIGLLLAVKHFIVDALMQTPYQYLNKGNIRHPGGYVHAMNHGVGTMIAFALFFPYTAILLGVIDGVIHFWVDWAKVNLTKKYGWSEGTSNGLLIKSESYFYALIADQCLHFATYIFLIFLAFTV